MKIRILYFAAARDITGISEETIACQSPFGLNSLTGQLVSKYGSSIQKVLDHAMYAVNMEYIDKNEEANTLLADNDEIAIIPPVSGG